MLSISVIIPVYNAEKFIKRAQLNLIRIADGETDGRYARTYASLKDREDYPALAAALNERRRFSDNGYNNFISLSDRWWEINEGPFAPLPVNDRIYDTIKQYYKAAFKDAKLS